MVEGQRMTKEAFRKRFLGAPVFGLKDIELFFPHYEPSRLTQWSQAGFLQKVRNGWYRLTETPVSEPQLWTMANRMEVPSYVSLDTALSHYGLIPESAFGIQSVGPHHAKRFEWRSHSFEYFQIKPSRFFGYRWFDGEGGVVCMATPEKALLDCLYFDPQMESDDDFEAKRLNIFEANALLDAERLEQYAQLFRSNALYGRYQNLIRWLYD